MEIWFNTPKEMVVWLLDNEGKQLADNYGRLWKYENLAFHLKDIGTFDTYEVGIYCLHLYGTNLHVK